MRKVVLEFTPGPPLKAVMGQMFEQVESLEFLELLRVDFEHGMKLFIADITLQEGMAIEDVRLPAQIQFMNVLKVEGRKHTCLVKAQAPRDMLGLFRDYDMDIMWDLPTAVTRDRIVLSVQGEHAEVLKLVGMLERIGTVRVAAALGATFHDRDLLDVLTPRQREVVLAAVREGYYDYPRRLNSEQLARVLGISKATVVEHLRKAEGRLMSALLAGQ